MLRLLSALQELNLDWFPRMRAMSLVSSDAEGEQNEIRNLQEKLESTMKLVCNLSGQLTELKDQVGSGRPPLKWNIEQLRGHTCNSSENNKKRNA